MSQISLISLAKSSCAYPIVLPSTVDVHSIFKMWSRNHFIQTVSDEASHDLTMHAVSGLKSGKSCSVKVQDLRPANIFCDRMQHQDICTQRTCPFGRNASMLWHQCLKPNVFPHFCQVWPFIEHPQEWSKYKKWSKKDWLVMLQRKSGHGRPSKRQHMWLLTSLHQIHPQKSTVLFTGQSCFDTETIPFFACSVLACSCTTTMIARVPSQQRTHSTEHFWRSLPTSFANLDYCRVFLRILPNGSLVSSDSFGHSVNQVNMR